MRRSVGLAALLPIGGAVIAWFVVGWSVAVLDSDSMEPWASPGDLLIHRIEPPDDIRVRDVVTVRVPDRGLVTNRVLAIEDRDEGRFAVLMGDASRFPDPVPVTLPDDVDRVALVVPRLGTVLRVGGPWLIAVAVLLLAGAIALGLAKRHAPTPEPATVVERPRVERSPVDPRIEALLASCEQFEEDGVPRPVVADMVRVRTAPVVGLPVAERSGAVLSLDDGGRFYVLAVADADLAMLGLVPLDSERRRGATDALDLWWDAVNDGLPPAVAAAIEPWVRSVQPATTGS